MTSQPLWCGLRSFAQSPLFLSFFSLVPPLPVVWALCDLVGAWALIRIWRTRQQLGKGKSKRDGLVAAAYLLNPYLLLPSLALSTSTFENSIVLFTLMLAAEGIVLSDVDWVILHSLWIGKRSPALLTLALSTHLSLSTILFLVPVLMLLITSPVSQLASPRLFVGSYQSAVKYASEFLAYWLILVGAASIMAGGVWDWIRESWGARSVFVNSMCMMADFSFSLTLPDLTPNPGLWWYFFTEMFDHFRPFFLMVFSVCGTYFA